MQLLSGELLIDGGSKQIEVYDPKTGSFSPVTGGLDAPWHFMTETRLKDGSVLLAGGYANNARATAQTWVFRPLHPDASNALRLCPRPLVHDIAGIQRRFRFEQHDVRFLIRDRQVLHAFRDDQVLSRMDHYLAL